MPLFDYECQKCGHKYEELFLGTEAHESKCKQCGTEDVKKMPGYMSRYEVKGKFDGRSPSRKRYKLTHD
jgi:putative FmdB family regulatory protein